MRVRKKEVPPTVEEVEEVYHEYEIMARYKAKISNPLTAIRSHCVECMGGCVQEIAMCTSHTCSLYPLRMGKNTFDKRVKARLEKNGERQNRRTRRKR